MKKIFYLLLCAVTITLFSCDRDKDPESKTTDPEQEEQKEDDLYDENGTAQMRVYFLVNDTMLNYYKTMELFDSLDNTVVLTDRQVRPADTLKTEDKYLMSKMPWLPTSRYYVIEYSTTLKVGRQHDFRIRWARNERALPGEGELLGLVASIAAFTSDEKVTLEKGRVTSLGVQMQGIKMDADPAKSEENMTKSMTAISSNVHLKFSFEKYK